MYIKKEIKEFIENMSKKEKMTREWRNFIQKSTIKCNLLIEVEPNLGKQITVFFCVDLYNLFCFSPSKVLLLKSWKCFLQSYSYTFDYLQKDFEKIFQKFCENKHVAPKWSKMLNKKKSNPFVLSETFSWFNYK